MGEEEEVEARFSVGGEELEARFAEGSMFSSPRPSFVIPSPPSSPVPIPSLLCDEEEVACREVEGVEKGEEVLVVSPTPLIRLVRCFRSSTGTPV